MSGLHISALLCPHGGQKSTLDPLELHRIVNCCVGAGNGIGFSERTASVLKHWTFSLVPEVVFIVVFE